MTQTLERPRVESHEQPTAPPEHPTPTLVRWLPWILILAMVVVGSVMLWESQLASDGSFDRVEQIRFEQIAASALVVDHSDEVAEGIRMALLMPVSDGSFDWVEQIRFEQIAASALVVDHSDEVAEGIRMALLMPVSDGSFDRVEQIRFELIRTNAGR